MRAYPKFSPRTDTRINRQHAQTGKDLVMRDITSFRLDQLGSVELSAGFSHHQRIATPPSGAKDRATVHRLVEIHSTSRLMLRAIVIDARLINDVWKMLGMAGRKAVVPPGLDMQQFIKRITVGQPSGPFLIRAEEIA